MQHNGPYEMYDNTHLHADCFGNTTEPYKAAGSRTFLLVTRKGSSLGSVTTNLAVDSVDSGGPLRKKRDSTMN